MEVGDLVKLSAKAKKLQWVASLFGHWWPCYGVITSIVRYHSTTCYYVHWFFAGEHCPEHFSARTSLYREHLKRAK